MLNHIVLMGRLTRDPELRTLPSGDSVCSFTIAVNRRRRASAEAGQPEADFIRVTAWRQLGELCAKYLTKGRKVCVTGPVSVSTYTGNDGTTRASLDVTADDVEFLSARNEGEVGGYAAPAAPVDNAQNAGFTAVETDELPF